jgi:carbamoyl-phosphate synthase large subunit
MPRNPNIQRVMILGSGPIVIGQACEFDYSGTQGCKALREEGIEVILVNSNPATIMTDPDFADRTYIEPLLSTTVGRIIEKETERGGPMALLPTLGGQTALNLAVELIESGVVERHGMTVIGAGLEAIRKAEDRELFKAAMQRIGLDVPRSGIASSMAEAMALVEEIGLPAIIRPSFTLGGTGGGIAFNRQEYMDQCEMGLTLSPVHQIMVEQSVLGWKEFELEVMRDHADNVVIICSIENIDPMGVHTGDSVTVAPAQTLTDVEYQMMRDAAIRIMREIGVDTGGSNVQFAIHPETGRMVVIEMNPRVSRSSALASKATGFPIAKFATKLAIGYALDEIANDITQRTPACFEPAIDYVALKIPRFNFEKFPGAQAVLGTSMKSVGEVLAFGRSFPEALGKAFRSLEAGLVGCSHRPMRELGNDEILRCVRTPSPNRLLAVAEALRRGVAIDALAHDTGINPWFIKQVEWVTQTETDLERSRDLSPESLRRLKRLGFSDAQIGQAVGETEAAIRVTRLGASIRPVYKSVDTCAGEFEAMTPYFYSSYERTHDRPPTDRRKVMVLGSGPNRIGQGVEFDYMCVQAVFALRAAGLEAIMYNCNPETVSTDYDISDRLYFEPLTFEDVMEVFEHERPEGVILQFGGQTPLKLAQPLEAAGVPILGTPPDKIDLAEDRERFNALISELDIPQPRGAICGTFAEVRSAIGEIGYPVVVRPSYVLGGRAMAVIFNERMLEEYLTVTEKVDEEHPILVDQYLTSAVEVDVDAVSDGERVVIGGVMEHIEEAGIHSGDSACVLPPKSLSRDILARIAEHTRSLGLALGVRGLLNIQFAVQGGEVHVLEVNPRGSRTVPFVSKATGVPLARIATRVMLGETLAQIGLTEDVHVSHYSVKEAVLPFARFPGCQVILSPEMRSTGEVMGVADNFAEAFAKAEAGADARLPERPEQGAIFITVADDDKGDIVPIAQIFRAFGFKLLATPGTREQLRIHGIEAEELRRISMGARPNILDKMINGEVALIINTFPRMGGRSATHIEDVQRMRHGAIARSVPLITTLAGARATVDAISALIHNAMGVTALQDLHGS